jgi:hypothetical protein
MLVVNPGDDSAAVILHNHYTFVLDLAHTANVDLALIAPASFVEDKAKTMIKKKTGAKPKANLELGAAKEETRSHLPRRPHWLSHAATEPAATAAAFRITMALGPEELALAMKKFTKGLRMASMTHHINNKVVKGVALTKLEIEQITKFFKEAFGTSARGRILALLAYIDAADAKGVELRTSERAGALANQANIPEAFRAFFYCFSRFHQGTRSSTTV